MDIQITEDQYNVAIDNLTHTEAEDLHGALMLAEADPAATPEQIAVAAELRQHLQIALNP